MISIIIENTNGNKTFSNFIFSIYQIGKDQKFYTVLISVWYNRHSHTFLVGGSIGTNSVENYLPVSIKSKLFFFFDSKMPPLEI